MPRSNTRLARVARTVGYGLAGAVTTAVVAVGVLALAGPLQRVVYDLTYLRLGPSGATRTATLTHLVVAGLVAMGATLVVGDALSDRLANRAAIAIGMGGLALVLLAFLALSLAGLIGLPVAVATLLLAALAVPLGLRYRYGLRSGALAAVAGGVPVLCFLVVLGAIGLGWGWGYVLVAEEVPDAGGDSPMQFDDAPAVRDDLFAPSNCEVDAEKRRTCRLSLRGYDHERTAARLLASYGVRCPFVNDPRDQRAPALATHEGTTYRIHCLSHGD